MSPQPAPARPCLVLASSGRLLAEALAGAGLVVDVCDLFGDQDCRMAARHCTVLPWRAAGDPVPDAKATLAAVRAWATAHPDGVLVAGAGFEQQPWLLAECAALLPLAGTVPAQMARCKDPWELQSACRAAALATPQIRAAGGSDPSAWLSRRIGGSGGTHIQPAAALAVTAGRVWQREIDGAAVSLLFHASAAGLTPLSWQHQYCAPVAGARFRFGGVVAVEPCAVDWSAPLLGAARALAAIFELRGLNGIDAIWDGARIWILEINPRPPASLALLTDAARAHWIALHVAGARPAWAGADAALQDGEPVPAPATTGPQNLAEHALNAGAAVVYACCRLSIPADFRFPSGCHDLPMLPHTFEAGEPVCSVQVCTGGLEKLRTLIGILRERLLPVAGANALGSL